MILESWREPRAFVKAMHQQDLQSSSKLLRPVAILAVSLYGIGMWWIGHFDPRSTQTPLWVVWISGIFLGWFLVYALPLLVLLCPAQIAITEKRIIKTQGNTGRRISAKSALGYNFETLHGFHALRIFVSKGKDLVVGLPSSDLIPRIEKALEEIKIQKTPDEPDLNLTAKSPHSPRNKK